MFPWRRKDDRWSLFDMFGEDFFKDLDQEFREMEKNMAKSLEEMRKEAEKKPQEGPYVYGFSMRVGPDGEPQIEKFGNVPHEKKKGTTSSEREPLTDVIEDQKKVSIVAELPGIEKEDINLNATKDSLTIDVDTANRKYHKEMKLTCKVKPETAKATYNNGVLEVKLEREKEKKEKEGVNIDVK